MSQLPLPLTPKQVLEAVIARSLAGKYRSPEADVMLLAIALQESGLKHRWQVVDPKNPEKKGPARGLWQFERGGGCRGVLTHRSSATEMFRVCQDHGVKPLATDLWLALEKDDFLACKAARLLLWTDPRPLPKLGDERGAWQYYVENWRPGKPHPNAWPDNYQRALSAVRAAA